MPRKIFAIWAALRLDTVLLAETTTTTSAEDADEAVAHNAAVMNKVTGARLSLIFWKLKIFPRSEHEVDNGRDHIKSGAIQFGPSRHIREIAVGVVAEFYQVVLQFEIGILHEEPAHACGNRMLRIP